MNVHNAPYHFLNGLLKQSEVERFKAPLAADFFAWCRENKWAVQLDLEFCKVEAPSALSLPEFKSRLAKAIKREENRNPEHWSSCESAGRLPKLNRIMAAFERFEGEL